MPYFTPARFWWVFLLVLLVVVVTGVKQSQLLVFKTWTKTGVGQKIQDIKTLGSKNRCSGKNWVKKDKSKKFGEKNLGKKKIWSKRIQVQKFWV